MEILVIRIYEGRKLLYDENGKIANKSNAIKIDSVHYERKFLQYYHTLGNVKVVIEDIYFDKNGEKIKMKPERIAELKAMLEDRQTKKVVITDPVKAENEDLKAHLAKLEKRIEALDEKKEETETAIDYSRKLKADLIVIANEKGITVPEDATKKDIIKLLK